ncbi:peptidylprolyl isomerase [Flavobacteriales bacterium 34_180_T64]|nr:peptidylprolyl isomerase [Flavobacteriales bacterium 34_180_T64]
MIVFGFIILIVSCRSGFKDKWTEEQAPDYFKARFETTKGNFDIEAKRSWSPKAVDRLYQLITHDYFTDISVYRVIPNYIAQFGIHNDSAVTNAWDNVKVIDELVIEKNLKGTISFARGGLQTRTNNLFINLKNNSPRLDTLDYAGVKGFPVVARITNGFQVAESFYGGYGSELDNKQDSIINLGNAFLKRRYSKLDYIHKAYIIK